MNADDLAFAYQKHIRHRFSTIESLPDPLVLHGYELADLEAVVRFKVPMIDMQVLYDLRELVNYHNDWMRELRKWKSWNCVLAEYEDKRRWDLRIEFVDPVARSCMLEPSAMKDRVLRALVFLLHHRNLSCCTNYEDALNEDSRALKDLKKGRCEPVYLSRTAMISQATDLAGANKAALEVLDWLSELDDKEYRDSTHDYRNSISHSVAPHFDEGVVLYVTRSIRLDMSVCYAFGERPALLHDDAFLANRLQFLVFKNVLVAFEKLLRITIEEVTLVRARIC